ncbi:hypothetical protein L596_010091 [Steinernema carpocapsae]|uniref:Uncharacterized protein n=1 Tax=Steinernema carpocapsae TaxID=34508 RepID=A0A4U5PHH7_STECR|nr:hypothetical protein L596_010091 [Steinernema carpocapsae]
MLFNQTYEFKCYFVLNEIRPLDLKATLSFVIKLMSSLLTKRLLNATNTLFLKGYGYLTERLTLPKIHS